MDNQLGKLQKRVAGSLLEREANELSGERGLRGRLELVVPPFAENEPSPVTTAFTTPPALASLAPSASSIVPSPETSATEVEPPFTRRVAPAATVRGPLRAAPFAMKGPHCAKRVVEGS